MNAMKHSLPTFACPDETGPGTDGVEVSRLDTCGIATIASSQAGLGPKMDFYAFSAQNSSKGSNFAVFY